MGIRPVADKKWQGKVVEKGQLITSIDSIKCATHLSPQQIRTCLARLESTGEILKKSTNKYTLITICNYESYTVFDLEQGNKKGTKREQKGNTPKETNKETKEEVSYDEKDLDSMDNLLERIEEE